MCALLLDDGRICMCIVRMCVLLLDDGRICMCNVRMCVCCHWMRVGSVYVMCVCVCKM